MGQGVYIVVRDFDGNMLATSLYHCPKPGVLVSSIRELVRTGGKHGSDLWSEVARGRAQGGWRSIDEDGQVETFADAGGSWGYAPYMGYILAGPDAWVLFFDQATGGLISVMHNGWKFDGSMFMLDKVQTGSSTELVFEDMKFAVALETEVFSTRWLER